MRKRLALAISFFVLGLALPASAQVVISEIMFRPPPLLPENPALEWIEVRNLSTTNLNLQGWRITKGIDFTFTNSTPLDAGGYLVIAADLDAFTAAHSSVANVVGSWSGKLKNSGETIELRNAQNQTADSVHYSSEGDWALRRAGDPYPGKPGWWRGWKWFSAADGLGKSLELINPALPNEHGQNWSASVLDGGTPGQPNSVAAANIAPMIVDVESYPTIPQSTNTITITARLLDEAPSATIATLNHRLDGESTFTVTNMYDDGLHGDGLAGDRIFGVVLPPQPDKSVIEFYVRATDSSSSSRTWPGPTDDFGAQRANALLQVDDLAYSGPQPLYRLIIPAAEYAMWLNLMDNTSDGQFSDATMNGTVVRLAPYSSVATIRHTSGIRNRGAGTRAARPHNFHINIPADRSLGGITRFNFNTRMLHAQAAGNALFSAAGLLNAYGVPVQVRVNGSNLANAIPTGDLNSYQFGSYYSFEPYDSDWAGKHIPHDSGGNVYKGVWNINGIQLVRGADLDYLGTNVATYRFVVGPSGPTAQSGSYGKDSNSSEDDWSDLINLTYTLGTNTPPSNYLEAVSQVVNIDQWLAYFAATHLVLNMETTLATGTGDDYSMYRGVLDPRFQLLNHDLDTVLGQGDTTPSWTRSIFRGTNLPTLDRFLKHPEMARRYFAIIKNMADTTFSPASVNDVLHRALDGWIPASYINDMAIGAERRRTNVLAQIPSSLAVASPLSIVSGYPYSTAPFTSLSGTADATRTESIRVNSHPATYTAWQGTWSISNLPLTPGINRFLVEALDPAGTLCGSTTIDIWYNDTTVDYPDTTIAANATWTAAGGPYRLTNSVVIPSGVTLSIEPGTTLFLQSGVNLTVASGGRLLAQGTLENPIHFGVPPGSGMFWEGLTINGSGSASDPESVISHAHFEGNDGKAIQVTGGSLHLTYATFGNTTRQYVSLDNASFFISHCTFPAGTTEFEPLHGTIGIKPGGRGIIRNSYFGAPKGYSDTIDFTGGNRNLGQPILQIYNNVFNGSDDDVLDLDGTDAWIEGNIFLHVHRNGGAPDSSSAISGGLSGADTSQVTIINNIIYDCDHAITAKEGNFYTLFNNTILRITNQGGEDPGSAVVNLRDTEPTITTYGAGAYLEGNIIGEAPALLRNYLSSQSTVTFTNNIFYAVPPVAGTMGGNNSTNSPLFVHTPDLSETKFTSWQDAQVMRTWLSSPYGKPNSQASDFKYPIGSLTVGRGGPTAPLVGPLIGIQISSPQVTSPPSASSHGFTLRPFVTAPSFPAGSGYTHYKYRLLTAPLIDGQNYLPGALTNASPWSPETPISVPITFTALTNGAYQAQAIGRRDSGWYQDAAGLLAPPFGSSEEDLLTQVSSSVVWIVPTNAPTVYINEILARNVSTLVTNGEAPDLIELYNPGPGTVSLSGMGLTDDPSTPYKFTFGPDVSLAAGQYLTVLGDVGPDPAKYLGFGLGQNGDDLYLFDSTTSGGRLLDSISFGQQLPDLSIGRIGSGLVLQPVLCVPTPGSENRQTPTGSPYTLKINEWLTSSIADDFVELFNPDPLPVHLGGLYLTDAPDGSPTRHQIRPLSYIAGNGFLAFIADGNTDKGPEHLDFSLSSEPGALALFGPPASAPDDFKLVPIDRVQYGPQSLNTSEGRTPNGAAVFALFATPTPGAGNPAQTYNVTVETTTFPLIGANHPWRYYPYGNDLGSNWSPTNFYDADWPLGFGLFGRETSSPYPYPMPIRTGLPLTNAANAFIYTFYFRTAFDVPTNLTGFTIESSLYLDDGAVFYVNGVPLTTRIRLPQTGVISYTRLADNQPSEGSRESIPIPASVLHPGTNYLAVEVHQTSVGSSDVAFHLMLDATRTTYITNYTSVVINEIMAGSSKPAPYPPSGSGDPTTPDWIELYNPSPTPVSLTGWSLTDRISDPQRWRFPVGAVIPSQSRLVVFFDSAEPATLTWQPLTTNYLNSGFSLDSAGDSVYLYQGDSLIDNADFGPQATDFSLGLIHQPSAVSHELVLCVPTLGSENIQVTTGDPTAVRINEWAASVASGPDWFELYNPNPQPVALAGLFLTDRLSNRIKHQIPPRTYIGISTNAWLRFVADNDPLQGPNHVGFALDGTVGEALGLFPPGTSPEIHTVTFGPQTSGKSQGSLPDGADNVHTFPVPSPGDSNWLPLQNIVVNEILSHSDLPLEDAIELHNTSPSPVNIGGWFLSDSSSDLRKFRIPDNTVIQPGQYKVVYEYQFNPVQPGAAVSFSFSSARGDSVWLSQSLPEGSLTGYRDRLKFGPQFNGVSVGRHITSIGYDIAPLSRLTFGTAVTRTASPDQIALFRTGPGAANPYPSVGPLVFTEIMYRPSLVGTNEDTHNQYLELHNISGAPLPLFHSQFTTNTWRVDGGLRFEFPAGSTVPAGGYLTLVGFDPATNQTTTAQFRSKYGVTGAILGPWANKLSLTSDDLEIRAPDNPQTIGPDVGLVPYVTVERVVFSSSAPWPAQANATGLALHRLAAAAYGNDPANWAAAMPSPGRSNLQDSDSDGIPNDWELAYNLNPDSNADAGLDPDNDRFTTLQEYYAGTNPRDAASFLRLDRVEATSTGARIEFSAAADRSYSILYKDSLADTVWLKLVDFPAGTTSERLATTDSSARSGASRYYRLVTPSVPQ